MTTETLNYLFGPNVQEGVILSAVALILLIGFAYGMLAGSGKKPKYDNHRDFYRRNRHN